MPLRKRGLVARTLDRVLAAVGATSTIGVAVAAASVTVAASSVAVAASALALTSSAVSLSASVASAARVWLNVDGRGDAVLPGGEPVDCAALLPGRCDRGAVVHGQRAVGSGADSSSAVERRRGI